MKKSPRKKSPGIKFQLKLEKKNVYYTTALLWHLNVIKNWKNLHFVLLYTIFSYVTLCLFIDFGIRVEHYLELIFLQFPAEILNLHTHKGSQQFCLKIEVFWFLNITTITQLHCSLFLYVIHCHLCFPIFPSSFLICLFIICSIIQLQLFVHFNYTWTNFNTKFFQLYLCWIKYKKNSSTL